MFFHARNKTYLRVFDIKFTIGYAKAALHIYNGGKSMQYTTEVLMNKMPAKELYDKFCRPQEFLPQCKECPDYGRVWSCPPGIPNPDVFTQYKYAVIIGVKLIYSPEELAKAEKSPADTEMVRAGSYGKVKKKVFKTLLNLEKLSPPSYTISAGRCELCERCARRDGLICRNPWALRYSFSAYGFDIGQISEQLLGVKLCWADKGLPPYNMAIYAFLTNEENMPELNI